MDRPHPVIVARNELSDLTAHLDRQLPWITRLPGVVGVSLHGGLSRGYGDHLSEIDIVVHLNARAYRQWRDGSAPLGEGIQVIDGMLYDVTWADLNAERTAEWEMTALWDASYARILHDPTGRIAALLADKLARPPAPDQAAGPLFAAWWQIELAAAIWIHRGDPLQGHLTLGQGTTEVIRALFLVNGEYVPHDKWLAHLSRSLAWTPPDWTDRLTTALCDIEPTIDGLRRRRDHLARLWQDVDRQAVARCAPDCPPELDLPGYHTWRLLSWLVERAPLPLAAWRRRAGADLLARAPFHQCVQVRDGQVHLDRDRLAALTDADLYSWHLRIVEAVRRRNPAA